MKKRIRIIGLVQVLSGFILTAHATVTVTNVTVAQRPGTKLVDIGYDVSSTQTNRVSIFLAVKSGITSISATNLTGDIGVSVLTGTNKMIVWNMGSDWNGTLTTGVTFTVAGCPNGGDPTATDWVSINSRWVKNIYANGNITMSDKTTGRMWLYDARPSGLQNWNSAISYCDGLNYANYSDWQLPDKDTLGGQFSEKGLFAGNWGFFWSSSSFSAVQAWSFQMTEGVFYKDGKDMSGYAWAMRNATNIVSELTTGASVKTDIDSRNYNLVINSPYGIPIPGIGTNIFAWHSPVICSVEWVINDNGTNYTYTGWTGTGSIPATGDNNTTGVIILSNLNSSITWQWQISGDIDNDGIPDTWEYQYSGNATGVVASADNDSDGYTNYQEYRFGTNPTNALSQFEFSCLAPADKNYAGLYFTTASGRDYTVEYRISLTEGTWLPFITMPGSGSPLNLKDYNIGQQRFYRVNVNMAE